MSRNPRKGFRRSWRREGSSDRKRDSFQSKRFRTGRPRRGRLSAASARRLLPPPSTASLGGGGLIGVGHRRCRGSGLDLLVGEVVAEGFLFVVLDDSVVAHRRLLREN